MHPFHLLFGLLLIFIGCPVAFGVQSKKTPSDGLVEFKSEAGNCTIRLPGIPQPVSANTTVGKATIYTVEISNKGAYAFNVHQLPIQGDQDAELIEKRLDGARNGSLKRVGAELDSEKKIRLGKYAGREFVGIIPDKGMLRSRIFLVDSKLYQILVVGKAELVQSEQATKVLQSLKLNK